MVVAFVNHIRFVVVIAGAHECSLNAEGIQEFIGYSFLVRSFEVSASCLFLPA
jgi:hypothetical protein